MGRFESHRAELRALPRSEWARFLTAHSAVPRPRANIELAVALAEEADPASVDALVTTDDEYVVLCGVVGLVGCSRTATSAPAKSLSRRRGRGRKGGRPGRA